MCRCDVKSLQLRVPTRKPTRMLERLSLGEEPTCLGIVSASDEILYPRIGRRKVVPDGSGGVPTKLSYSACKAASCSRPFEVRPCSRSTKLWPALKWVRTTELYGRASSRQP